MLYTIHLIILFSTQYIYIYILLARQLLEVGSYNYNSYNRNLFNDYEPSYSKGNSSPAVAIQDEDDWCGCSQPVTTYDEYSGDTYCTTCLGLL